MKKETIVCDVYGIEGAMTVTYKSGTSIDHVTCRSEDDWVAVDLSHKAAVEILYTILYRIRDTNLNWETAKSIIETKVNKRGRKLSEIY